ncbi:hypothetical protein [Nonomuraea sp. NPDC048901]
MIAAGDDPHRVEALPGPLAVQADGDRLTARLPAASWTVILAEYL